MTPAVSVIVTTYDRLAMLAEALGSVESQTFTEFEVIVVNDHPPTGPLVRQLVDGHDERFRLVDLHQNLGASEARNAGMAQARGALVALLDDDDLWMPDYLARHLELHHRRPEVAVVYSGYVRDSSAMGLKPRYYEASPPPTDVLAAMVSGDFTLGCLSIATVKTLYSRQVGGFDPTLIGVEDWDWFCRLAQVGPFGHIPEALSVYREHPGSRVSMSQRTLSLAAAAQKWADYPIAARFFRRVAAEAAFAASRNARLAGNRKQGFGEMVRYLGAGRGTPDYARNLALLALLNGVGPWAYRRLQGAG